MADTTRVVTIPLRVFINVCLLLLFFTNYRTIRFKWHTFLYLCFSTFYLLRIIADINYNYSYYISHHEVLQYYFSFSFIPFISCSLIRLNQPEVKRLINALICSSFIFAILAVAFYHDLVGVIGRMTVNTGGEAAISPLILSYCSTLIIGVLSTFLLFNKSTINQRVIILIAIILSIVPFFLGASRGSLVALFVPLLCLVFAQRTAKIKYIYMLLFSFFILVYLNTKFDSSLLNRFLGLTDGVEAAGARMTIWESSFSQFSRHPLLGDKLEVNGWGGYPHNIFLEVLQTTGIIGFLPFILLVGYGLSISFKILRNHKIYAWLPMVFLQALMQNLFSGAIHTAAWFWTSLGLVFALQSYLTAVGPTDLPLKNRNA